VEGSNKRNDRGHSSNDLEFLLIVLSERHFRIFANLLPLSIFFLATMGEGASQVNKPRASHHLNLALILTLVLMKEL